MPSFTLYFAGIALGLGLIGPIGPINLFLVRQGLVRGLRGSIPSIALIGLSDSLMISLGAVAAVTVADQVAMVRLPLTIAGALYLTCLAVTIARTRTRGLDEARIAARSFRQTAVLCLGVVWLNPHALIDAFGVLGNAISVQPAEHRLAFALGVISASWIWYIALTCGAAMCRRRIHLSTMFWFNRLSAVLVAGFAGFFWIHLLTW